VDAASLASTSEDLPSWNNLASGKREKPAEGKNFLWKSSEVTEPTTTNKRKRVSAAIAGTSKSPRLDVKIGATEPDHLGRPGTPDKASGSLIRSQTQLQITKINYVAGPASSPKASRGRSRVRSEDAGTDELEKGSEPYAVACDGEGAIPSLQNAARRLASGKGWQRNPGTAI
jgi:hypothetical protein